jgi:hypothetical protein
MILYHDLQTLFTVMISIVFASLIIHEFDNDTYHRMVYKL